MPRVTFETTLFKNKPYPMRNEYEQSKHPLSEFKVSNPQEWDLMQRKIHDRVWFGIGEPLTKVPSHLIDSSTKSLKSAELLEFKKSAKPIMRQLPRWHLPARKMDATKRGDNVPGTATVIKQRKNVTIEERDPVVSGGNVNYFDLRNDNAVKGANVLYSKDEDRPLDEDERKRAGILLENGKRVKIAAKPSKTLAEEPINSGNVEDTWSMQGFSFYSFMIGGRYNRFDTFDDVLFRDYGILLPRKHPCRVYFTERIDEEEDEQRRPGESDNSSSVMTSSNTETSSSERLHFTMPTTTLNSTSEMMLGSSTSNRDHSRSTFAAGHGDTATTTTPRRTATSLASSAYYYETNQKSVKALMERLASTLITPKTHGGKYYGVSGNYLHAQIRANAPKTVLKGGPRGGRSFTFSHRPMPLNTAATSSRQQPRRNDAKIDQLISLGYQLATASSGKGHHD